MKKIKLLIGGLLLVLSGTIHAQVSVTLVAGTTPGWGPSESVGVRYYYLPDVEAYYDVNTANYIYMSNGRWIHSSHLPAAYGNYDLYGGYKVVLNDYHGERPYDNYRSNRRSYPKGYNNNGHGQKTYGERPENRDRHDERKHDEDKHNEGEHRDH